MPRRITVATASLRRDGRRRDAERNLELAVPLLGRAATQQPDIVCLPETFGVLDVPYTSAQAMAEPVPGPTTDRLAAVARRHQMYVVCPLLERAGPLVYNAAVLLDRQGAVVGVYRKLHPTIGELEQGVTPGDRVVVFDTDFGRIGVLICFDLMFPDRWREAKQQGAEVLFWPSAYEGGLPLAARACDYECYVVSCCPVWHSPILDITGYVLASTGQRVDVAWAELDLEKRLFSTDYNMRQYHAILAKYGRRVSIEVLSPDGVFTLAARDPELTVAMLIEEFGLETQQRYVVRSAALQEQARTSALDALPTDGHRP